MLGYCITKYIIRHIYCNKKNSNKKTYITNICFYVHQMYSNKTVKMRGGRSGLTQMGMTYISGERW